MNIINLYNEKDGIRITVDQFGNWTTESAREAEEWGDILTEVVGHASYACSFEEAAHQIAREYRANHQPLCEHCGFPSLIPGHNPRTGCSGRTRPNA